MSLRRRAAVSFLILITIVVIASAALARAFADEVDRQSLITDRIEPAARLATALQAATARTAAGIAQYVVTGENDERLIAKSSLIESTALLTSLRSLVTGDPAIEEPAGEVTRAHDAWLAEDVKPLLADMAGGSRAEAASRVDDPAFQARFAELDSANARLITAIEGARSHGLTDLRRITRDLGLALAVAAITALCLSAFSIIALRAWIIAPLDRVRADLREAALLPSHETPIERTGPVEIAEVAGDAEALRRALLREIDAAEGARIALGHGAPAIVSLQREMSPPSATHLGGIDVFGTTRAAEGVIAGDWWDAVELADGAVGLVLADVSGHDIDAGVTAVGLRSVFRTGLLAGLEPGQLMELAAGGLRTGGRLVTAFVAIVRPGSEVLAWANAGHPPPLLVGSDGSIRSCDATGQLLSPLGGQWHTGQAAFRAGDVCLAFTDGLVESLDTHGEELGQQGVIALIESIAPSARADPAELAERVISRARLRASVWHADDITVLAYGPTADP